MLVDMLALAIAVFTVQHECLAEETFSDFHQKLLASKTLANFCLFAFCIAHIIKGKSPVIRQIHQRFPPPTIYALCYVYTYIVHN